ncbi:MAG: HAD family hydrolase [Clostridia bacterium]|nr:HAD family hydrolase [Clostridia bacterium]
MIKFKPQMIIFDVGGTLFSDGNFNATEGLEQLRIAAVNPEITSAEIMSYHWNQYINDIRQSFCQLEIPLSSVLKFVAMKTGLQFDIPMYKQEEIFDRFNSSRSVIDGVEELLKTIKSLGIRSAIISNNMMSGESLEESIKLWIPESDFEFCLTSADLLIKKPDKKLFEAALNFAGVNACDCFYCGDGFIPDVCGSLKSGMNSVLLDVKSDVSFEIRNYENKQYIAVNNWNNFSEYLLK